MIEITVFTKVGGPLTKRIYVSDEGKVVSDGSACVMSAGRAKRICLADLHQLAGLIGSLGQSNALALGTLGEGLPDKVEITTKVRLEKMNGAARPELIARTSRHIVYRPNQSAFALLLACWLGLDDGRCRRPVPRALNR